MRDFFLSKTLLSEDKTEKIISQARQNINYYHANNSIFYDNGFVDAINGKYQKLTFCGLGARHKNVII